MFSTYRWVWAGDCVKPDKSLFLCLFLKRIIEFFILLKPKIKEKESNYLPVFKNVKIIKIRFKALLQKRPINIFIP